MHAGAEMCTWLWLGAGAGVAVDPVEANSVFPAVTFDAKFTGVVDPDDYSTADVDQEAMSEIRSFAEAGWLSEFDTIGELESSLGGPAVISPFHVVVKHRSGKIKRRLILDLRRSGISARTRHTHRVVLPSISDAVQDALRLLSTAAEDEQVEFFILDFQNAF